MNFIWNNISDTGTKVRSELVNLGLNSYDSYLMSETIIFHFNGQSKKMHMHFNVIIAS